MFPPATYDSKVGTLGALGLNHIRTPCTEPFVSLNETYQYELGGCWLMPGSVSSSNRSFRLPSLWYGCESCSDLRSVPAVPVRLSPLSSVRIGSPGAVHGVGGGGGSALTVSPSSFDAGPAPWPLTATTS